MEITFLIIPFGSNDARGAVQLMPIYQEQMWVIILWQPQKLNFDYLEIIILQSMIEAVVQVSSLQSVFGPCCEAQEEGLVHLQQTFSKLYDGIKAETIIMVNGVVGIMDLGSGERVSLAMGKGVTVLVSSTYPMESIFVNGSHFEEEIIFSSKGKHQEGIHEKSDELRDILTMIRQRCSSDLIFDGAVIYVHSDINQNLFSFQECLMLSLTLALLIAHNQLSFYTTSDIVALLKRCDPSLSQTVLRDLLQDYSLGCGKTALNAKLKIEPQKQLQIRVVNPNSEENLSQDSFPLLATKKGLAHLDSIASTSHGSLDSLSESVEGQELKTSIFGKPEGIELVACRIQVSKEELEEYQQKMAIVREFTAKILEQNSMGTFKGGWGQSLKKGLTKPQMDLYSYAQDCQLLLQSMSLNKTDIASFLRLKHDLDVKYQLHNEQVIEIINQLRSLLPRVKDYCIIEGSVMLAAVEQSYVQDFIRQIRRLLVEYRLSSYLFLETHERIGRRKREHEAEEAIFQVNLSLGCAIFHPKE